MKSERSGNSPRGRRGRRGTAGRSQQPGPGFNVRADGQRRSRGTEDRGARGNTGGRAGWKAGAPRPARSGAPAGGYQRRESGTSGWTAVRPWRPPRDDADEAILDDDDTQPNWDQIAARTSPRRGTGTGPRPPAWPGNQQGGRRRGVVASRPPDRSEQAAPEQRAGAGRGPRKPASGGRRRRGTWMPPGSAANDE